MGAQAINSECVGVVESRSAQARWASALLGMLAMRVKRPRVGKLVRGGMQGGKTVLGSSTGHWADVFQRKDHGVEPCASAGGHITLPMVVDKKKPVWVVGRSGAMVVAHTASGCR